MGPALASRLAAAAARRDVTTFEPTLLDAGDPETASVLLELIADPTVVVVDALAEQVEQLVQGRVPGEQLRAAALRDAVEGLLEGREPERFGTWAFYPWSRRLVHVLPEPLHRELRLDRNRYAITTEEQERLTGLCVAVAGLSVGRAVVSTMAHEGVGGELRLADFDVLDLSNLNRVAGGLADVGVSKVVLAAREVAELDPYIRVVTYPGGVQEATIADFVAGADVVVDECDDLEMKVRLREHARAAGRPVVMATSHRGMLDVERFDLEPDRPTFHGLLGDVTSATLGGLTTKQKVPYVIRILDPASLTDRAAASMVEVKESVSTWPQLASDVALGGAMVANAVRRIALGELTASGRFHADLDELTADGRQAPLAPAPAPQAPAPAQADAGTDAASRRRGADARGGPLRRRVRELGSFRREHAAVALRGAGERHPRLGRPDAILAAGLPRPRRAARARRRPRGGEDRRPRARLRAGVQAGRGGRAGLGARARALGTGPRRGGGEASCGSAAATGAPGRRRRSRRPSSRGSRAVARRSTRASWPAPRWRSSARPWGRWIACASSRPGCGAT